MEIGNGTPAEQEAARQQAIMRERCRTDVGFRAALAEAWAADRAKAAAEAEIERRLASAWFAAHPIGICQCRECI